MNFDNLVDDIFDHPRAKSVISEVQQKLKKEEKARHEFREWLTPDTKAEFINGEIVLHSPALARHLAATRNLLGLINAYVTLHKLGEVYSEKALLGHERNDYEPDIAFWGIQKSKAFHKKTLIFPPADFVVEILSDSTASRDRGIKYEDYAAHSTKEYWIIDADKETVEQYTLDSKNSQEYSLLGKFDNTQTIDCQSIKGFSVPVKAIFDNEINLKTLGSILASA